MTDCPRKPSKSSLLRANTIYRLARDETDPSSVIFDVLKEVLDGLRELTGENIQVTDLISYAPDETN